MYEENNSVKYLERERKGKRILTPLVLWVWTCKGPGERSHRLGPTTPPTVDRGTLLVGGTGGPTPPERSEENCVFLP